MDAAEKETNPITAEKSSALGVSAAESRELHSFLKDRTGGLAASVVRDNVKGVGLESWRLLCKQFNPKTLMGTMAANQLETHPKAASKMSELSGCIMEWDKNLRRCVQEGRPPLRTRPSAWPYCECCQLNSARKSGPMPTNSTRPFPTSSAKSRNLSVMNLMPSKMDLRWTSIMLMMMMRKDA